MSACTVVLQNIDICFWGKKRTNKKHSEYLPAYFAHLKKIYVFVKVRFDRIIPKTMMGKKKKKVLDL